MRRAFLRNGAGLVRAAGQIVQSGFQQFDLRFQRADILLLPAQFGVHFFERVFLLRGGFFEFDEAFFHNAPPYSVFERGATAQTDSFVLARVNA